jgi:hypothetical protein
MSLDLQLAIYRMVNDYPGGAAALAPYLGKSAGTLSHEANPRYPSFKMGVLDCAKLMDLTGDRQVLGAMAAGMGCMVIPLPAFDGGAGSVAARTAALATEFGQLMAATVEGLADGSITDNERERIEREGGDLMSALQCLMGEVRSANEATRPAAPAAGLKAVA